MKKTAAIASATLLSLALGSFTSQVAQAAPPANTDNVTICHRTHSVTNPYVRITVDKRSVGNANSKHGGGAHDDWATSLYQTKPNPNVYDPSKTYPANDKKWGDIIAFTDVSGNPLTGSAANVAGLNNTGIGAAIFNGTGAYAGLCRTRSARDYYEIERAAGVPPTDILNEMNELDSPEFANELSACGGTFTGCNPEKLGTPTVPVLPPGTTLTAGKGALTVKIWIDKNRNGSKSDNEKNMANVTVKIKGPNGVEKSGKTDANGNVSFTDLDPGSWSVTSVLALEGYEKVYDADGSVNWATTLAVVEGAISETSFAAATKAASSTLPATGASSTWLAAFAALMLLTGFVIKRRSTIN
jgi:LPXTG-motif cell wall-anchored protein